MEESCDYVSIKNRNIYFNGEVNQVTIGKVAEAIIEINQSDREEASKLQSYVIKPIHLFINSNGGSVTTMFGLIDIITNSFTPVFTYNNGICASAGLKILMAGHQRFGRANSQYMLHAISGGVWADIETMDKYIKRSKEEQKMVEKFIYKRSKITKEFLKDIKEKKIDYYFFSKEALEMGVIDEIL